MKKGIIPIAALLLFGVSMPLLHSRGFLCFEGFLCGLLFVVLYLLLFLLRNKIGKGILLRILLPVQIAFITLLPIGMLIKSQSLGGIGFFLSERIAQYIYLEAGILVLLGLFSTVYVRERKIRTLPLLRSLFTPLNLIGLIRLAILISADLKNLPAASYLPSLHSAVILISIPLILGVLVLAFRQILFGYFTGLITALAHLVLSVLFIRNGQYTALTTILFLLTNLIMIFFCIKGGMEYHFRNGLPITGAKRIVMRTMLTVKRLLGNPSKLLTKAGVLEGMRVLDYGCGVGNFTVEASKLVGASGSVLAVDRDEKILEVLRKRLSATGSANVQIARNTHPSQLPGEKFDCILLIDVLHMLEDKVGVIRELMNRLSPNGAILIKFEHFTEEDRETVLNLFKNSSCRRLIRKYWIINGREN